MNFRRFSVLFALAVFATASTAEAAVHRVFPGESIQAAIDDASPGDTILVEPGIYKEEAGRMAGTTKVGLHITTNNLRLIGKVKKGRGEEGKVRVVVNGGQETGIYAAPADCGPEVQVGDCPVPNLQGFYIRGFTVEDFPRNGIQTRFVNDFKIIRNESARNLHNGIYPTISANGLVQNNVSYGSADTAMWVAASSNVRVMGNELYDSVIGLEVNVSLDIEVKHNDVHDNTVGIGLFHPNSAGNRQLPKMGNWVVEHNNVYDNNTPNFAPEDSFQASLPPGVGILVLGVSDNVVAKNTVEDNNFVGIGVLGWCTATSGTEYSCDNPNRPPEADPAANNNLVSQNQVSGNGTDPPPIPIAFLAADLTYFEFEGSSGNCFEKNKPAGYIFVSSDGELPTDGC